MDITKAQMQKVAMSARKEAAADGIKKINEKIADAAMNGKFEVFIPEDNLVVSIEMLEELREKGFKVKQLYGDIDDYGQYYMGGLKIY